MGDDQTTWRLLEDFAQAFNRHDLDGVVERMTEDCVFLASAGSDVCGERFAGQTAVRAAFADVIVRLPDVQWNDPVHSIMGDRAIAEWRFTCTQPDARKQNVAGLDVFRLRDGKIAVKSAFRKIQTG